MYNVPGRASVCISGIPGSPAAPTPLGIVASIGMKDPPLDSLTYNTWNSVFTNGTMYSTLSFIRIFLFNLSGDGSGLHDSNYSMWSYI